MYTTVRRLLSPSLFAIYLNMQTANNTPVNMYITSMRVLHNKEKSEIEILESEIADQKDS